MSTGSKGCVYHLWACVLNVTINAHERNGASEKRQPIDGYERAFLVSDITTPNTFSG